MVVSRVSHSWPEAPGIDTIERTVIYSVAFKTQNSWIEQEAFVVSLLLAYPCNFPFRQRQAMPGTQLRESSELTGHVMTKSGWVRPQLDEEVAAVSTWLGLVSAVPIGASAKTSFENGASQESGSSKDGYQGKHTNPDRWLNIRRLRAVYEGERLMEDDRQTDEQTDGGVSESARCDKQAVGQARGQERDAYTAQRKRASSWHMLWSVMKIGTTC